MAIAPTPLHGMAAAGEADQSPPTRRDRSVVLCLMAVCFLFNIEGTVVAVAIPSISEALGMSSVEAALMASLYYIGMTLALAPMTVLASRYCIKRMLLVALAVFLAGALVAWRATGVESMLLARTLQGIGGGGLAALSYGSVGVWFEPRRVGWAFGLVNAAIGCGMLLGAPLGGGLIALASWSAIFWVTAAVAALVFVACAILLTQAFHAPPKDPFLPRLLRSILFGIGLAGMVYAVSKLGGNGLSATDVRVAGSIGLAALAATVLLEWRAPNPLVPHEVWRGGRMAVALLVVSSGRGLLIISNFVVPFLLGIAFGSSAAQTGALMAVSAAAFAGASPRSAALAQRIGPAGVVARALLLTTAAFAGLAVLASVPSLSVWIVAVPLLVLGVGSGLTVAAASRSAVEAMPVAHRSRVSMLLPTAGFVGMACHVTLAEWLFAWRVDGGFSVAERIHDAAEIGRARSGFVVVFTAAAAIAVVASLLARRLARMERAG
jgi:DHA2 family multidrug resistance protein-like MFS transporter